MQIFLPETLNFLQKILLILAKYSATWCSKLSARNVKNRGKQAVAELGQTQVIDEVVVKVRS